MLETSNFVHRSAMRSLSLVMSECSLSGRGQGHASNFYIVDLKNFATASRRYTGDIHNSTVIGLFMKPTGQWKRLDSVMVECTCLIHSNFIPSILSGLVVQVVSALLRGKWQDFNWHDASRGPTATAEHLVWRWKWREVACLFRIVAAEDFGRQRVVQFLCALMNGNKSLALLQDAVNSFAPLHEQRYRRLTHKRFTQLSR